MCPSYLTHSTNHITGSLIIIIMSCYIGLFETFECSNNIEYSEWFGQPKAALNTTASSTIALCCTNCTFLSPDDHDLRGKICGEFNSRSWWPVFGEYLLAFPIFALGFITVTWSNVSCRMFENLLCRELFVYLSGQEKALSLWWSRLTQSLWISRAISYFRGSLLMPFLLPLNLTMLIFSESVAPRAELGSKYRFASPCTELTDVEQTTVRVVNAIYNMLYLFLGTRREVYWL